MYCHVVIRDEWLIKVVNLYNSFAVQMARTQKNKATAHHLGLLKVCISSWFDGFFLNMHTRKTISLMKLKITLNCGELSSYEKKIL